MLVEAVFSKSARTMNHIYGHWIGWSVLGHWSRGVGPGATLSYV